jgi:hypothetical protein
MNGAAMRKDPVEAVTALTTGGFEIEAIPGRLQGYKLAMKGFLAPGWTGRLTAGLASHRLSIVSGRAEKVTATAWDSSFELKAAAFSKDPLKIDFVALAAAELPYERTTGKIALLDFVMEPCSRHDGSLYLEIRGVDRLGFLGDLLDYFSMRCLFPVKMTIDTVGDTAVDRFWLRGVGGSKPSDSIACAVKDNLEKLLIVTG